MQKSLGFVHCLQGYVVNLSKIQDWERIEEPQSSRSAWIKLLRRGTVCARAVAGRMASCPGNVEVCNRWKVKLMYAGRITENRKLVLKGVISGSRLC